MNRDFASPAFDQRVADWLENDPDEAPGAVLDTVLAAFPSIPQRRASRAPWRFQAMSRFALLGAAVTTVVAVSFGGLLLGSRPNGPGIHTSASPSLYPSTSPQTSPTASPSASTMPAASVDGYEGTFTRLGTWSQGGNHDIPITIALADGRVLVAGGGDGSPNDALTTVLDPGTGAPLLLPAVNGVGTGVLLPDGRVFLIAHDRNATSSAAYLVDPTAKTVRKLPGSSNAPAFGVEPSLALLRDGRVLVAGGLADVYKPDLLASALLFDPGSQTFETTGSMHTARWHHAMVTLGDGRVLVAAGEASARMNFSSPWMWLSSAEVYDPTTGRFAEIAPMQNVSGRAMAALLRDGRVAVLPQWSAEQDELLMLAEMQEYLAKRMVVSPVGEVFDPTTLTFTPALGSLPSIADSATTLADGRLLVTGASPAGALASGPRLRSWAVEYNAETGSTTTLAGPEGRLPSTAALPDGRVVLAWSWGLDDYANTEGSESYRVDIFR